MTIRDVITLRPALLALAEQMELVLRKHDHKTSWRELPLEALMRKMRIELQEFDVALDFLKVAEARSEIVDVMNFLFFIYDRLAIEHQDRPYQKPASKIDRFVLQPNHHVFQDGEAMEIRPVGMFERPTVEQLERILQCQDEPVGVTEHGDRVYLKKTKTDVDQSQESPSRSESVHNMDGLSLQSGPEKGTVLFELNRDGFVTTKTIEQ